MALRPSSVPLRVPLPHPPKSSLPAVPDPECDLAHATSPNFSRLLATNPSFKPTAASALVAELVGFAAFYRLDYATALVAQSESPSPLSVEGECALGKDVIKDRQEDFECLAAAAPHFDSMLLAPEGDPDSPDIPIQRSYAEAITSPYSSQWQIAMDAEMASWKSTGTYVDAVPPSGANIGVDYFQTFSPTLKMTTLRLLLHAAAQRDYELHSLDFSTAFLQGRLHEEIGLRCPPSFTGSFPAAEPSWFLRTDTSLPPFYVLVYIDDLVFATADTEALTLVKSELQKRHTCTDLGELCEAEIYAGAMAAQELHWLSYMLIYLGEQPCSPPVLYVDSKAMIALCEEHRLEHRTKHIALRYFLARELQQRGQLRLAYVATRAISANIFTKALHSGDHQRISTVLGLFDMWLDDLYLLSDSKDAMSLFHLASGAATAPPATADNATRSQWLTRDAAARLAIRNHLPLAECAHFGQQRTAQALYDAVVIRYSSPATAALGRLLLPYLFPELSAFATVKDLPPMFITLYFIVTRLPDSLRSVRDHFLSLDPTSLTVDLLEQHLLAAETSAVAVGAARGTPRPPFFEGCSPSPLAPSYTSAAAADVSVAEDVGADSASAKSRSSKGKGGRGGGGGSGGGGGGNGSGGGGSSGGSGGSGGGGGGGTSGRSGGSSGGGGGSSGSGSSGGGVTGGSMTEPRHGGPDGGQRQQQQRPSKTQSPQ
ncbi:unnamed protein product [Closterium sp. NIES-54]